MACSSTGETPVVPVINGQDARCPRLQAWRCEIRHAKTLDEQVPLQKELDNIRRDIRRARANVSAVEDETDEKRRRLLDALQRKLVPEISREELFTIRWRVV